MKIQSAGIRNFRSLKDVEIVFDSVTTLIGPNGAGKSTVLRALDWFFNAGKGGELTERDCSFGAVEEDIEVRVTFTDLTDRDREELGKYAPKAANTFTAWKRRLATGPETLSANAKGLPDFVPIKSASGATDKKNLYKALRESKPELELPAANTGAAVDQAMATWEADHTDQLVDAPEALQTNFFGFNSSGKMSGLFDFVLVTGDLRANEEAQDAKASTIGRILERSLDRASADEEINKIVEDSRAAQQKIYAEKFSGQLEAIKEKLNGVVSSYSPSRSVHIVPTDVEFKAPRTTFDVSVLDGATETAVDGQGHGFQRTLLISALQVLAESTAADTEGVICLAIEEPELFQHPTQAQAFARVLRALADDPEKRMQVAYATHSPYFLEARHFDQIRRLARSSDDQPVVTAHSATVDDLKTRLAGVTPPEVVERQLDALTAGQVSAALFASRALVVEGTTEAAVFYGVGDRFAPAKLESEGIAVVAANGKGSVPLTHAVLSALGIPAYAVFDSDAGFETRAKANGKPQDKIDNERAGHVAANRKVLKYFGRPDEDFPAQEVGDAVAIIADNLEALLDAEWPEWVAACSAAEESAGIDLGKNQFAYRAATARATGEVPQVIAEILKRVEEV